MRSLQHAVKKVVLEPEVVGSTTYPELVTALGDLMAQARTGVAENAFSGFGFALWKGL